MTVQFFGPYLESKDQGSQDMGTVRLLINGDFVFYRICGEGKKFSSEGELVGHIDTDHSFDQFYQDDSKPVREVTPEPPAEEQPQHDQGLF